jgi:hypothetical protein
MPLTLRQAPAAEGAGWVRDGFRLYARRMLGFTLMFVAFLAGALLLSLVPLAGGVLMLASLPMMTLGFMLAARSAQRGGPVHAGQFIEPLRGPRAPRRELLSLCLLYALTTALILAFADWFDGGSFERLQMLLAKGDPARAELDALLGDPRLSQGLIVRFGLASLLSVPFWHAPALVYWQRQGVGQALFSSTLALWRCRGAFLVYALAWAAAAALFGVLATLLVVVFDARQLAGAAVMPAALVLSAVFYVSLIHTYDGCFREAADDDAASEAAPGG